MNRVLAAIGWGVLIYAVMYLAWSGLVIYGLSAGIGSLVARMILLVVVTAMAARYMRLFTLHDIVPIALGWALIAAIADSIFLTPFTGWALYSLWSVWAGYALIVAAPTVATIVMARLHTTGGRI